MAFLGLLPTSHTMGQTNKEALDYLVNAHNDTIYGILKNVGSKKMFLKQKVAVNNKGEILYKEHLCKEAISFRHHDKIYRFSQPKESDGIYADATDNDHKEGYITERQGTFLFEQKLLPDYVVTYENDTIYGEIKPSLINFQFGNYMKKREHLRDSTDQKILIKGKTIKAYRKDNQVFEYKHTESLDPFELTYDLYLRLRIIHPKVKLYERIDVNSVSVTPMTSAGSMNIPGYDYTFKKSTYYLEKDGKLFKLKLKKNYREELSEFFADHSALVSLIQNDFFDKDDIYLIVKYYTCRIN
ncbi:MAG: hypothetical protein JST78_04470 [Bacteroidetes bacterium]|nr:hypothetical protein [Bacteroidota bacterium]